MINSKKTYEEIIAICGEDFNPSVTLNDGNTLEASCWTDDDEVIVMEAAFDITTSWGDGVIGRFDNLKGELDIPLMKLSAEIEKKVGGSWAYDAANCQFVQR